MPMNRNRFIHYFPRQIMTIATVWIVSRAAVFNRWNRAIFLQLIRAQLGLWACYRVIRSKARVAPVFLE